MTLFDYTFHAGGNEWLAEHVISNGNHFVLPDKTEIGTAVGASFICIGTSANTPPLSSTLQFVVPKEAFRESANLVKLEAL